MIRLAVRFVLFGIVLAMALGPAQAERRAALVIGINEYSEVADLEKAVGDAEAMAQRLRLLGFEVTELLNADRRTMNQAISTFSSSLSDGDVAFVHFSGHGVDIDGENYLLPADIPKPISGMKGFVKSEAVAMSSLIGRIADAGARTRVFVIDACRNNPFEAAGVRAVGSSRGLARVEAPAGTFIMYSAGYRQEALDRLGPDDKETTSVYTRTLLKHLGRPGQPIADVARDVRGEVQQLARRVGHDQRPAYYDELSARLVLVEGGPAAPPKPQVPVLQRGAAAEAWAATMNTTSAAVLEAFIQQFPDTVYAALARARLTELEGQTALAVPSHEAKPGAGPGIAGRQLELELKVARATGTDSRGRIGVWITSLTNDHATALGLKDSHGAWVAQTFADGPANKAGIQPGDVVLAFDGKSIADTPDLARTIVDTPVGKRVAVAVWRLGRGLDDLMADLERRADAGDVAATAALAKIHVSNFEGVDDKIEALRWVRAAADQGVAEAQYALAGKYNRGDGVAKDEGEAARWYRKAADQGHAVAQDSLGKMYALGRGVAKDEREAVRWYRKAAENDNPSAMDDLGYAYATGRGVAKDEREAAHWYRKAADSGLAQGMFHLALMYGSGSGVAKDEGEAARWYREAAERGSTGSMINLGFMLTQGRGLAKDEAAAADWFRKAADAGNPAGMRFLGGMYAEGKGVAKDEREAVRWYRKAADLGDARAQNALGSSYANGSGVAKDEREALRWYRKAADGGDSPGMFNLALNYANGRGVTKDSLEAARWYRKAVDKGHLGAMHNLAIMYSNGQGIAADHAEAAKLVFRALDAGYAFTKKEMLTNAAAWSVPFRRELQRLLKQDGVYKGTIDGQFGPGTRRAIEALASRR